MNFEPSSSKPCSPMRSLAGLIGSNGRIRYDGCSTHLGHGRSMEGSMGVQFSFAYVLRPEQL